MPTAAMLDVEYLQSSYELRQIAYRYRSGALVPEMKAKLAAQLQSQSLPYNVVTSTDLNAIASGVSLLEFQGIVCDLGRPVGGDVVVLAKTLAHLSENDRGVVGLLLDHVSPLAKTPEWIRWERSALSVQEPALKGSALRHVLQYLLATSKLGLSKDLVEQSGFLQYFIRLVDDGGDLNAVITGFDELVLTATDRHTGRFDGGLVASGDVGKEPLGRLLRTMIEGTAQGQVDAFLVSVSRALNELGGDGLVRRLYTNTHRLLRGEHKRSASLTPSRLGQTDTVIPLAIWAMLLLKSRAVLLREVRSVRAPSLLMVLLRHLSVEFRQTTASLTIPISHLKTAAGEVARLADGPGDAEVRRMVDALVDLLANNHHPIAEALRLTASANDKDALRHIYNPPAPLPVSFDAIIGQDAVVRFLRDRVRDAKHATPIILHGPDGVGKSTIARLYAKAALCLAPKDGSPCNTCVACLEFSNGGGFGYVPPVDLGSEGAKEVVSDLRRVAETASFSDRKIILMDNVDKIDGDLLDVLLKTLEDPPLSATFVLLARDLKAVRVAGVSRSIPLAVLPLSDQDARALVVHRFEERGIGARDELVDIVIECSSGLPGQLAELSGVAVGYATAQNFQVATGLDWVLDAPKLLREAVARMLLARPLEAGIAARLKLLLCYLALWRSNGDTAFAGIRAPGIRGRLEVLVESDWELRQISIVLQTEYDELLRQLASFAKTST